MTQRIDQVWEPPMFATFDDSHAAAEEENASFRARMVTAVNVGCDADPELAGTRPATRDKMVRLLMALWHHNAIDPKGCFAYNQTLIRCLFCLREADPIRPAHEKHFTRLLARLASLGLISSRRKKWPNGRPYRLRRIRMTQVVMYEQLKRSAAQVQRCKGTKGQREAGRAQGLGLRAQGRGVESVHCGENWPLKVSDAGGETVLSIAESGNRHRAKCPEPINKKRFRNELETPPGERWSDIVELLGERDAEQAAESLSPFRRDRLNQLRRHDKAIDDWLVDELLLQASTTTEGVW